MARVQEDRAAEQAIKRAIDDVNQRIVERERAGSAGSRRSERSRSPGSRQGSRQGSARDGQRKEPGRNTNAICA